MVWDPRSDSGVDNSIAVSMQEAMACACLASTRDEAEACRELLADHSIPSILGKTVSDTSPAIDVFGVPVLVPKELLEEASDVLACFEAAAEPEEWDDEPFDDDDDEDEDDDDYDDDYDDDVDDDFEDDFDDD